MNNSRAVISCTESQWLIIGLISCGIGLVRWLMASDLGRSLFPSPSLASLVARDVPELLLDRIGQPEMKLETMKGDDDDVEEEEVTAEGSSKTLPIVGKYENGAGRGGKWPLAVEYLMLLQMSSWDFSASSSIWRSPGWAAAAAAARAADELFIKVCGAALGCVEWLEVRPQSGSFIGLIVLNALPFSWSLMSQLSWGDISGGGGSLLTRRESYLSEYGLAKWWPPDDVVIEVKWWLDEPLGDVDAEQVWESCTEGELRLKVIDGGNLLESLNRII